MDRYLLRAADEALDTVQNLISEIEKLEEIANELTYDIDELTNEKEKLASENYDLRHQIIQLEKDLADLVLQFQSLL